MRTLIVLPTYNEAPNLPEVLRRVRGVVPTADVLVVDDGSPDGTADLAEAMGRELGQIEVLRRAVKGGLGSAYRDGFRVGLERGYEVLVEMDADFSHDPSSISDLVAAVEAGAALVVGSRYVPGGSIPDWPWYRRGLSRYGNAYARLLLGLTLHDATSGFRAFRSTMLEKINLDEVQADGYGFQVEMAYRVERLGGTIVEVPIEFRDRLRGKSKMSQRIVLEALLLVTWWGLRDRFRPRR